MHEAPTPTPDKVIENMEHCKLPITVFLFSHIWILAPRNTGALPSWNHVPSPVSHSVSAGYLWIIMIIFLNVEAQKYYPIIIIVFASMLILLSY